MTEGHRKSASLHLMSFPQNNADGLLFMPILEVQGFEVMAEGDTVLHHDNEPPLMKTDAFPP